MILVFSSKLDKFSPNSYSSIIYDVIGPILTTPDPDEKQKWRPEPIFIHISPLKGPGGFIFIKRKVLQTLNFCGMLYGVIIYWIIYSDVLEIFHTLNLVL